MTARGGQLVETLDSLRSRVLTLEQALRLLHNESGAYRDHVVRWVAMSGDHKASRRLEKALVQARLAATVALSGGSTPQRTCEVAPGDKLIRHDADCPAPGLDTAGAAPLVMAAQRACAALDGANTPPESESGTLCRKCGRRSEPVPECIRNEARLAGHKWWCAACGYPVGCHYYDAQNAPPVCVDPGAHAVSGPRACGWSHAGHCCVEGPGTCCAERNAPPPEASPAPCRGCGGAEFGMVCIRCGVRAGRGPQGNAPQAATPAEVELTDAASALAWAQACIVRAARALVLAAGGNGVDGASLAETAAGVAAGLMEVDAAIALGGAAASDSGADRQPPVAAPTRVLCACAEVTPDGSDWRGKPGCAVCGGTGEGEAAP